MINSVPSVSKAAWIVWGREEVASNAANPVASKAWLALRLRFWSGLHEFAIRFR